MRVQRWSLAGLLFGMMLGSITAPSAGQTDGDPITLREIKYADLGKAIRGLKGKVVLVDFWAEY